MLATIALSAVYTAFVLHYIASWGIQLFNFVSKSREGYIPKDIPGLSNIMDINSALHILQIRFALYILVEYIPDAIFSYIVNVLMQGDMVKVARVKEENFLKHKYANIPP